MRSVLVIDPLSSGELFLERLGEVEDVEVTAVVTTPVPTSFIGQAETLREKYPQIVHGTLPRDPGLWTHRDRTMFLSAPWSYVVSGGEPGVQAVDAMREHFSLSPRNEPGSADARIDKFVAQEALRKAGLDHIRSWSLKAVDDLSSVSLPCVVKPSNSAGSDGVGIARSRDQLFHQVESLWKNENAMRTRTTRVVAQEVVEGTEYVVDGFVGPDGVSVASICRYSKDTSSNSPIYRSLTWLQTAEVPRYEDLLVYLSSCLEALGVSIGTFHFEAFDTGEKWKMVEVGLRPHGGGHPRFTEHVNRGVSQISLECEYISGNRVQGSFIDLDKRGRVVFLDVEHDAYFTSDPQAAVGSISGVADKSMAVGRGDGAVPARSLFDTFKIGFVFVVADTVQGLNDLERDVRGAFRGSYR